MPSSKYPKPNSTRPYIVIYETGGEQLRRLFRVEEDARQFIDQYVGQFNIFGLYDFNEQRVLPDKLPDHDLRRIILDEYIENNFPKVSEAERLERQNKDYIRLVLYYYTKQFAKILGAMTVAGLLNHYGFKVKPWVGTSLATFFFSGGTLGYLILWKIQTWGGTTPPERVNEGLLVSSYIFGAFFTILAL